MKRIAALALILSAPAAAQTTNCQWFGAVYSCTTTPPIRSAPPPNYNLPPVDVYGAFQRGYQDGVQMRKARVRREVGKLVQAGQCDMAKSLALSEGEIELAAALSSVC